jgi:hypothetical protein
MKHSQGYVSYLSQGESTLFAPGLLLLSECKKKTRPERRACYTALQLQQLPVLDHQAIQVLE